jgi:hypothetical protein
MPDTTTDAGASSDTSADTTNDTSTDTSDADQQLGDAGKAALDRERSARRDAERQAKAAQRELEQLRQQSMSDAEKAVAKAKEEGKAEALTTANGRLVKAEVRVAAAGKIDPALAVRLLDLEQFKVDDDGEVDNKAIARAIDQLLKEHPNLAANGRPGGSADGGPRGGPGPMDMNALIRSRMRGGR